ncbi:MAG: calcium-binding protein [Selenomonadaceae bacterium]|nr:calcium-binding protein [Selenomonadaceae bacterium]
MANRNNDKDGVKITGTAKADIINNGGSNVTIEGGKGNDSINSWGEAMAYVYSGGNDTIEGFRLSNTLVLGKLTITDSVINYENGDVTLTLSNGGSITLKEYWDLPISTVASVSDVGYVNIIRNDKGKTKITGTSGRDFIETDDHSKVTIDAGAGKDYIRTGGKNNFVNLGDGNDIAENWGDKTTINAGAGNDYVDIYAAQVSINAGAGNDSIGIGGDNVTIVGGQGNDLVWGGNPKVYVYSAGNDTIDGFQRYDTLVLGKLTINDSIINYENGDTTLNMSNGGSILLRGYWDNPINTVASVSDVESFNVIRSEKNKAKITGTSGRDYVENNDYSGLSINTGAGNDYVRTNGTKNFVDLGNDDDVVENGGDNNTINGGAGNDTIWNIAREEWNSATNSLDTLDTPDNVTILGGDGSDYIYNQASNKVLINGDAGNDSIRNFGTDATISGGKGNDSLWGSANADTFIYASGDGKDVIYGFDSKDTLTFDNLEFTTSYSASKGTITFKVDGGSVTLKDFTATTFHVNDTTYQISGKKLVEKS